jgi:hypothetical protein
MEYADAATSFNLSNPVSVLPSFGVSEFEHN